MDKNLKDILSNLNPDIDQETLLLYLQGKLSAEQQHEVEKGMVESDFESDAVEGLSGFKNKKQIQLLVDRLNRDLKKRTAKKRLARKKTEARIESWLLIAIILILVLAVLGYVIIRNYSQN